jgi:hypothetical protein
VHQISCPIGSEGLSGGKAPGSKAAHFHLLLKVKKEWICTSISPYVVMALCLIKHRVKFKPLLYASKPEIKALLYVFANEMILRMPTQRHGSSFNEAKPFIE